MTEKSQGNDRENSRKWQRTQGHGRKMKEVGEKPKKRENNQGNGTKIKENGEKSRK